MGTAALRFLLDQLQDRARAGAMDPSAAIRHSSEMMEDLSRLRAQVLGTPPARMLVVPPAVLPIVHTTTTPVPSGDIEVIWPCDGRIIGIGAAVPEDNTARSRIGMTMRINGIGSVFSSGRGDGYIPLSLFGDSDLETGNFLEFIREVSTTAKYFIRFQVLAQPLTSGSVTYTPIPVFLFEPNEEAAKRYI